MKILLKYAISLLRGIPLAYPKIKEHSISIEGEAGIKRVVHISDLHIGEFATLKFCKELIRRIDTIFPDIILISGDMITSRKKRYIDIFKIFSTLKSKDGIFFVAGNRELECFSLVELKELCEEVGFRLLEDEVVLVGNLKIAGITNGGENLKKNLSKISPKEVDILFSHQPKSIKAALKLGIKTKLFVCGHTHGGQLNPFGKNLLKKQNQPYFSGMYSKDKMLVYVNSGVGSTVVPLRFLSTSEIASLNIESKP